MRVRKFMKCTKDLEVRILKSEAGYYIGTLIYDDICQCDVPNCRISQEYYKTEKDAQEALELHNFTVRRCIENDYCNSAKGCFTWQ